MANHKPKLELTWIGKENRPKLEPRVLIEDAAKSYHAARRVSENDILDNRLERRVVRLVAVDRNDWGRNRQCRCTGGTMGFSRKAENNKSSGNPAAA